MDNKQCINKPLRELSLFAGGGGGILGGLLLGWQTICAVEYEPHGAAILAKRQNDGILQPFPIWDNVQTFDGKPWKGIVDVVSGGFPCQDISTAGRGKGIEGKRSGLWKEMARIICEVRPQYAFVENSPALTFRGLGEVLADLAKMGYNAKWGVLGAEILGAPHERKRIWIVANSIKIRWEKKSFKRHINVQRKPQDWNIFKNCKYWKRVWNKPRQTIQDCVRDILATCSLRIFNDVAHNVDRLERIGDGQVPAVVELAWKILSGEKNENEN